MNIAQAVNKTLVDDGWKYSFVCFDEGGFQEFSRFSVTVTFGGNHHTFEYYSGYGNRVWNNTLMVKPDCWLRYFKAGERVTYNVLTLRPTNEQRETFKQLTRPINPTLDEVVFALWGDASNVANGETLAEFCDNLGYDTDSVRANEAYDSCRDAYFALVRMGADLDRLSMLFQEY
jgi:hypothetical protein